MHLPMAASLPALSCAEACDAKAATETTTDSARRYLLIFMTLSATHLVEAFAISRYQKSCTSRYANCGNMPIESLTLMRNMLDIIDSR